MIEPQHDRRIKLQIKRNKNRYVEIQKKDIKRNKDDNKIEQNYRSIETKICMTKYKKRHRQRYRQQKNRIERQINRNRNRYEEIQKKYRKRYNRTIDQQKQKLV